MLIIKLVNITLILGGLGGILWLLKRRMNKYGTGYSRATGHVQLVDDGIQFGTGQKVAVIRVGDELFLYTHGPNGVFFQPLQATELLDNGDKWAEELGEFPAHEKPSFAKVIQALKKKEGSS